MNKKKVTSSDVAKYAGVSQTTVSMILNKKYNVSFSRETVEKVESAARELGYQLPGHKNKKENKKTGLVYYDPSSPAIQVLAPVEDMKLENPRRAPMKMIRFH